MVDKRCPTFLLWHAIFSSIFAFYGVLPARARDFRKHPMAEPMIGPWDYPIIESRGSRVLEKMAANESGDIEITNLCRSKKKRPEGRPFCSVMKSRLYLGVDSLFKD
jgi:hypothetical protein